MQKESFRLSEMTVRVLIQCAYRTVPFAFYLQKVWRARYLIFTLIILTSCTRENIDDCFTNTGPQITEDRPVESFHNIELYDNVNLVLIPGTSNRITVEGGEHIIDAITTEINDSTLIIRNTMKCNWVRNFDRELTVYATVAVLDEIRYEGSGDISTLTQLSLDSLQVSVWGGAGSFNLDLKVTKLNLALHYGTVDFHVKGKALMTTIFANSYGPFFCNELISNIVYIRNSGSNNCYVYAVHVLDAEITSVGDIYYSGDPYHIGRNITGSGQLIKVE